ncbi:type II CAAX endopeptidase family protein [Psychrobacillus sp. NEAU-3TGS]|uniref:CPBP family intramembrane glutamic endopeptidase n=1 Tax=Psychrobacillus sp. NEAU-3TGS TaxID=2995412 RepID=UPI0024974900|nr:type II CAAX endopeptidase family protein [Psychrobacillus sp. NEAU-3TGS]MDI2586071.1 type II CAAX endopeptidase family protein [Psychrobacillus sp. NEAU-3TGS]
MIKQGLLLIMPTVFIYIGLSVFQNILITFLLFYGWLLFIPLFVASWKRTKSSSLQLAFSKKNILVGIISGLICLISIYGFVIVFQSSLIDIKQLQQLLERWDFSGTKVIILVLVLALINPILEELYWREFMYGRISLKLGNVLAVVITAIFYSMYHLIVVQEIFSFPFNVLAVIPVFLAGIMWGIFRIKLGSITAPIISHCLADIGIMLVYWNIIL